MPMNYVIYVLNMKLNKKNINDKFRKTIKSLYRSRNEFQNKYDCFFERQKRFNINQLKKKNNIYSIYQGNINLKLMEVRLVISCFMQFLT